MGLFKVSPAEPDSLHALIRQIRLTSNPVAEAGATSYWTADAEFYPPYGPPIKAVFNTDTVPPFHAGDVVYAVLRAGWEVLSLDTKLVLGRIAGSTLVSPNRWLYTVQTGCLERLAYNNDLMPYVPTLNSERPAYAVNLCEIENQATGLMGNGMDMSGLLAENEALSCLAPVPAGTLIFMTKCQWEDTSRQEGNYHPNSSIYVFQFQNQYCCPFASHITAITEEDITGPDETTALKVNKEIWKIGNETVIVTCPLLRPGETLDGDTPVIVSFNIRTREWQIIEAQCPAGGES